MNPISLRIVDLNLLVILDVVLQERSVSRAAHRLPLTPFRGESRAETSSGPIR